MTTLNNGEAIQTVAESFSEMDRCEHQANEDINHTYFLSSIPYFLHRKEIANRLLSSRSDIERETLKIAINHCNNEIKKILKLENFKI